MHNLSIGALRAHCFPNVFLYRCVLWSFLPTGSHASTVVCDGVYLSSVIFCGLRAENGTILSSFVAPTPSNPSDPPRCQPLTGECPRTTSFDAPDTTTWANCIPCLDVSITTSITLTTKTMGAHQIPTATFLIRTTAPSSSSSSQSSTIAIAIVIPVTFFLIFAAIVGARISRRKQAKVSLARLEFGDQAIASAAIFSPQSIQEGFNELLPTPEFVPYGGDVSSHEPICVICEASPLPVKIMLYEEPYDSSRVRQYTAPFTLPPGVASLRAFVLTENWSFGSPSSVAVFKVDHFASGPASHDEAPHLRVLPPIRGARTLPASPHPSVARDDRESESSN